eukprot:GEMP01055270.1.p1 GENE.GEMP01055270.1~~GEMP01055270.1.p1  ORF type:complete len:277 (+),score=43.19 GEMP01055270.1:154-984(+)
MIALVFLLAVLESWVHGAQCSTYQRREGGTKARIDRVTQKSCRNSRRIVGLRCCRRNQGNCISYCDDWNDKAMKQEKRTGICKQVSETCNRHRLSHDKARRFCEKKDQRLCTLEELKNCKSNGCHHGFHEVWIQAPTPAPTTTTTTTTTATTTTTTTKLLTTTAATELTTTVTTKLPATAMTPKLPTTTARPITTTTVIPKLPTTITTTKVGDSESTGTVISSGTNANPKSGAEDSDNAGANQPAFPWWIVVTVLLIFAWVCATAWYFLFRPRKTL